MIADLVLLGLGIRIILGALAAASGDSSNSHKMLIAHSPPSRSAPTCRYEGAVDRRRS
jgi:hypothetical protein